MTKAREIKEIIAEQANSPGEQRALEHLAERLDETLARDVPYRPEFKAELRHRLMAQARRTASPWYKRPAVWGSSMALAAAAAVFAVGLQLWEGGAAPTPAPSTQPAPSAQVDTQTPKFTRRLTGSVNLPVLSLPDDVIPADQYSPTPVGDLSAGAPLVRLTGRPDERQVLDISRRLGIEGTVSRGGDGVMRVSRGPRSLELTPDGRVDYRDASPAAQGQPVGLEGARVAARSFLERAELPVPDLAPAVSEGPTEGLSHAFTVTFTQKVDGRPVVNARTVVRVTDGGAVAAAQAYVQAGQVTEGTYEVLPRAEAVKAASGGATGAVEAADLVWVRTASGEAVYLQPYWRVFGTESGGKRSVRYVPALVRDK